MVTFKDVSVSLYIVFLSYTLMTLFIGDKSIYLLENARFKNLELSENIRNLENQQNVLLQEFNALRSDPDSIKVRARSLNLYSPQDKVVLFNGYSFARAPVSPGEMIKYEQAKIYDKTPLRIISLSFGGLYFLFLLIRRGLNVNQAKR